MKNENYIKKFFPFAFYRPDKLAEYLTEMRRQGFMFEDMSTFNVLKFKPVNPRDDLRYVVLNYYFPNTGNAWKIRDWDILFMKQRFPQFDREFHNCFKSSSRDVYKFVIYCTSVISDEDIEALKQFRKKRLKKINAFKISVHLFNIILFAVLFALALAQLR